MNPQLLRNEAVRRARSFFAGLNILEVRTGKIVPAAAMEPYIDAVSLAGEHISARVVLATSPEMAMKKIFAAELAAHPGAAGIYEIAAVFRDDRPGKNHAIEFTMLEWYVAQCQLVTLLQSAAELIAAIADVCGARCDTKLRIFDLRDLFAHAGYPYSYADGAGFVRWYRELHSTLPSHLSELDLHIAVFNLLFDEHILPQLRLEPGLCAARGYPDFLAAMAYSENGVAERAEIYFSGVELANGYREEFRPDILRARWQAYNAVRDLRKVEIHPIDEELLAVSHTMQGVAGIAVGLERVLAAFAPGLTPGKF